MYTLKYCHCFEIFLVKDAKKKEKKEIRCLLPIKQRAPQLINRHGCRDGQDLKKLVAWCILEGTSYSLLSYYFYKGIW